MKKIQLAVFLALAGSGFYTQSANAAAPTAAGTGDVFLGFYDPNSTNTQDFLIDIGPSSLYTTPGATFTLSTTYTGGTPNVNTQLTTMANGDPLGTWYTGGYTSWGVFAGPLSTDPASTMYAGIGRTTNGVQSTAPLTDTPAFQTQYIGQYNQLVTAYQGATSTAGSSYSVLQAGAGPSSWATLSNENGNNEDGTAFGYFGTAFGNQIDYDGADDGDQIDFYKMPASNNQTPGIYEGFFAINSTGQLTYTPASSVPEPSALTALAGGAGLLGLIRRRRAVAA